MCKFFVVSGNGQALLGMLDINTLNIIKINCITIHMEITVSITAVRTQHLPEFKTCATLHKYDARCAQGPESCANIDTNSKFKNKDMPMVIDKNPNTIGYFLPGPNQDDDKG